MFNLSCIFIDFIVSNIHPQHLQSVEVIILIQQYLTSILYSKSSCSGFLGLSRQTYVKFFSNWLVLIGCPGIREWPIFVIFSWHEGFCLFLVGYLLNAGFKTVWLLRDCNSIVYELLVPTCFYFHSWMI